MAEVEVQTTNPLEELRKLVQAQPTIRGKRLAIEVTEDAAAIIEEITDKLGVSTNTLIHGILYGVLAKYENGMIDEDQIATLILEAKNRFGIKVTPKRKKRA